MLLCVVIAFAKPHRYIRIRAPLTAHVFPYRLEVILVKNNGQPNLLSETLLAKARDLFPHTRTGVTYLDHAATSPLSTRVVEAMSLYLQERSSGALNTYSADLRKVSECRSFVQRLINAESPDRIALVGSTSDSINIIASGIPWKTGDRVVMSNMEFPANVYPYLALKRHGVEIDVIGSDEGRITSGMIEAATTPRTRLVALSAVQFLSGYRADLATIGEMCRRRGILFVVDGIQAIGAVQVDVQAMHIDAIGAGSQKWQMGPHGTGFLYLTEELQKRIQQQFLGWLSVEEPWDFHNYGQALAPSARRYEGGSLNYPGIWGMHAALATLLEFGIRSIEGHIHALTEILTEGFRDFDGFELCSFTLPEERAGIVTIRPTRAIDLQSVFRSLANQKIIISLREGRLRFSPHFYNSPEEVQSTVSALVECIASTVR